MPTTIGEQLSELLQEVKKRQIAEGRTERGRY
jgi:hypothetical protein